MSKSIPLFKNDGSGQLSGSIGNGKADTPKPRGFQSKGKDSNAEIQIPKIVANSEKIKRLIQIKKEIGIKNHIVEFITEELKNNEELRKSILFGKEVGHTISSHIDVSTSRHLISKNYPIKHEIDVKTGEKTARSFGDVWIEENGRMNPINIKTGLLSEETNSSPNMTSMNRLKNSFLSGSITAYYLAIIKFNVNKEKEITPVVYFIDALNFVDYLNYNTGTGQIMIKEKELYKVLSVNPSLTLTREEKIEKLKALYLKGVEEGERKMAKLKEGAADFDAFLNTSDSHVCDDGSLICSCGVEVKEYAHMPKDQRSFE